MTQCFVIDLFSKSATTKPASKVNPYDKTGRRARKEEREDEEEEDIAQTVGKHKKIKIDMRTKREKKHAEWRKQYAISQAEKSRKLKEQKEANQLAKLPRYIRKQQAKDKYNEMNAKQATAEGMKRSRKRGRK